METNEANGVEMVLGNGGENSIVGAVGTAACIFLGVWIEHVLTADSICLGVCIELVVGGCVECALTCKVVPPGAPNQLSGRPVCGQNGPRPPSPVGFKATAILFACLLEDIETDLRSGLTSPEIPSTEVESA